MMVQTGKSRVRDGPIKLFKSYGIFGAESDFLNKTFMEIKSGSGPDRTHH